MLEKIKTKDEIKRKQNKNKILIGVVLVALMVLSTLGYSLLSSNQDNNNFITSEGGSKFYRQNNIWSVDHNGQTYQFQSLPSEVKNIQVQGDLELNNYLNKPIYFVNPSDSTQEILTNLQRYILRYQEACLVNSTCENNLPIKDCNDNLIIFENSKETKVEINKNCVYIKGDAVKGSDAFLYKLLKIN